MLNEKQHVCTNMTSTLFLCSNFIMKEPGNEILFKIHLTQTNYVLERSLLSPSQKSTKADTLIP